MKKLFFLFIAFFSRIFSQIKDNPIFLVEGGYPIVLSTEYNDDYYYVLTDFKNIKIEKESGNMVNSSDIVLTSSNSIYIADESKNNYIINESNQCFKIIYNPFLSFKTFSIDSLNITTREKVIKIGSILQNDDFIIYGYYNNKLFFSSYSQSFPYFTLIEDGIIDNMSCKFIKQDYFICVISINNEYGLYFLNYSKRKYQTFMPKNR